MNNQTDAASSPADASWRDEIGAREEAARLAFLHADMDALNDLFANGFVVNSPLQRLMTKPQLFDALRTGRIRHLQYEGAIEHMTRLGDIVIVMGNDWVTDAPDGALLRRRFTNVWSHETGAWRLVARHAHVVSREPAVLT